MRRAALIAVVSLLALACASDLEPGQAVGRQGRPDAVGLPPDAAAPDGAVARDRGPVADGAPPPARAAHAVWWVLRTEPWEAGLRAALDPPQRPTADPVEGARLAAALAAQGAGGGFLVRWAGPQSPGEGWLQALRAAGLPAAPLYALGERAGAVPADVAWLAAHHGASQAPGLAGGPILAVEWSAASPAAQATWRARLALLPAPPPWIAVLAREDPPPPDAAAVLSEAAYGHGPEGLPPDGADGARLARQRAATHAAGLAWLPRARPGTNPRLRSAGAWVADPGAEALERSLVLARRAAQGVVVVDGLGGWRDDRQLDPVGGVDTAAPAALTDGQRYPAYGEERLRLAVARLTRSGGAPPPDLAQRLPLPLFFAPGVSGEAYPDPGADGIELTVEDAGGATGRRAEWLLEDRPFRLPPGVRLRYRRSDPALAVDLVFSDGRRLLTVSDPGTALEVAVPLDAFAGRRVEELALVVFAAGPRLAARLEGLRLELR